MNRTKIREIGGIKYCIYCAEEAKRDSEGSIHNKDRVEFDVCNCPASRKAILIKEHINKLWVDIEDLPRIHEYKLNKMQFDIELKKLREIWGVPVNYNNSGDK